jgi:serine/threonine protein kinase
MGGVLLRMLIGRAPFEAPTYGALLTKIVNDPPPSLVEARSDIPLALEQVVHRALAKNRDQRFGSIAELAEALAPFAAYEVAELTSISQSELTRQLARIATSLRRFFSERVPSASSIRALGVSLQSVRERRTRQLIPRLSNSSTLVGIGVGVGIALAIVLPLAHSYISRQAASPDAVAPSANAHEVRFVTPTAGDQTRTDRPKGVSISTQVSALSASSELIAAKPDTSVAVSARTAASGRVVSNKSNKTRPVRLVVDVEKTARKTPVQQEPTRKTRAKSAALRGAILPGVDGRKQLDTKARTVKLRNAVRASVKVTFRCAGVLITANVPPQGQASAALPPESCQVSCVGMGGPVCPKALSANTGSLEIL